MGLKVAIVGLSPSSHDLAPFGSDEWETWGLAWDWEWPRLTRTFEIHSDTSEWAHMERLEQCNRLYIQSAKAEYPDATPYPLEAVIGTVGDYFQSSIAYMLALAIHEGATEISLYGVDMGDDTEYGYQKANCEYLIGLARGKGITVHIPESSPLCKYKNAEVTSYKTRYGWAQ